MTKDERNELRRRRAALDNPVDRIVFDNQRGYGYGLPLGLILQAFEEEDCDIRDGNKQIIV